jgi:Tol biopolymer transport system component
MNADDENQTTLTNNPGTRDALPVCSPNGNQIAFDSFQGSPADIG